MVTHTHTYTLTNILTHTNTRTHTHTQCTEEREWLAWRHEETKSRPLSEVKQRSLLDDMIRSQAFDNFLSKKFGTLKRYGAEGAEAMMGFFLETFTAAAAGGCVCSVCVCVCGCEI